MNARMTFDCHTRKLGSSMALPSLGASVLLLALAMSLGSAYAQGIGLRDGRLQPPSLTPNSVTSQAGLYQDHPQRSYAEIKPLRFNGSGTEAMRQLSELVRTTPGATVITQTPNYLHAEMRTSWLKFTDDLELLLDEPAGLIHVRSASRLGQRDFGANRKRVELLRSQLDAAQNAQARP